MTSRCLLALVLLTSCGTSTKAGTEVKVRATTLGPPAAGCPDACEVTGSSVALAHAYVTVESVELLECPSGISRLLRVLSPISQAWAHGTASPTATEAPVVLDMRTPKASIDLGSMSPPVGTYCEVRVTMGPPDEDAVSLPSEPDVVGKSVYIDGTTGSPLAVDTGARSTTLPLPAHLVLDSSHLDASLAVQVGASGWLVPLDPTRAAEDNGAALLQALVGTLTVSVH